MGEDIQRRIREKISEIEEKSASGDYIYRGEPETHEEPPYCGKVSSSLWREYGLDMEGFDIEGVQEEMLSHAKKHTGDPQQDFVANLAAAFGSQTSEIEFELLTEIQHYGGRTNLIDYTTDYLVALFFACDGHHNKDGRVILQKTEDIKDMINFPRNPRHRVIAQKSIFVRPPKGFIKPNENDIVTIPGNLKQWILQNLRKYHNISTETIYNDLYGFIRHQGIHGGAYTQFYRGFASIERGNEATTITEKQEWYAEAINHYTQSIQLDPNQITAYNNRGLAYSYLKDYNSAINDFHRAIEINPNYADAYNNRGVAYIRQGKINHARDDYNRAIELNYVLAYFNRGEALLYLKEWEKAKSDLTTAKEMGVDIINSFRNDYTSIEDFRDRNGFGLPEDIAEMLTPTQNGDHT